MAKHPKKAWSQWNVEIPNKNPWFRAKGVFNMNGGEAYISYMVSPKGEWQTGFTWCISFLAKHDSRSCLAGSDLMEELELNWLAIYILYILTMLYGVLYTYKYHPFPHPQIPKYEIPLITQSKPRGLVLDLVISGICQGGPWRLLGSMCCSRDWILPFGKSTAWWIQMFFFLGGTIFTKTIFSH